jgi:phosphoribosyl 1,2-cyclic phosphodiesterase
MRVCFWGVRGSVPVPGPQTNRYGGNTSCVEIIGDDGLDPIIIDAGTGIRKLGKRLAEGSFGSGEGRAHLLISHTHWDHIQGLPYFAPLHNPGNELCIYARQRDTHLRAIFAQQNEGPYFPVPLDDLKADVEFHELVEGNEFSIERARVSCTRLNHPWIAMAYRIDLDGTSVVYASDTAPFTDILLESEFIAEPPEPGDPPAPDDARKLEIMRDNLVELCRGVDLLIYDTQFTPAEYREKPHWGHSTPDDAIAVAREAGAKSLALFHHAPNRTDDEQDAILAEYRDALADAGDSLELFAASEGLTVEVGQLPGEDAS